MAAAPFSFGVNSNLFGAPAASGKTDAAAPAPFSFALNGAAPFGSAPAPKDVKPADTKLSLFGTTANPAPLFGKQDRKDQPAAVKLDFGAKPADAPAALPAFTFGPTNGMFGKTETSAPAAPFKPIDFGSKPAASQPSIAEKLDTKPAMLFNSVDPSKSAKQPAKLFADVPKAPIAPAAPAPAKPISTQPNNNSKAPSATSAASKLPASSAPLKNPQTMQEIVAYWNDEVIRQLAFVEQQSAQIASADQKIVRECRSMFAHKQHLDTALFEYDEKDRLIAEISQKQLKLLEDLQLVESKLAAQVEQVPLDQSVSELDASADEVRLLLSQIAELQGDLDAVCDITNQIKREQQSSDNPLHQIERILDAHSRSIAFVNKQCDVIREQEKAVELRLQQTQ